MIYAGDNFQNFAGSMFSADFNMTKDVLLSELHRLIDTEPEVIAETLRQSGVYVPQKPTKKKLIHLTVDNLYDNSKFQKNISEVIGDKFKDTNVKYSNAGGLDPVSAVSDAVSSVANVINTSKQAKAQKEADKQRLIQTILQGKRGKTNWLPIIIIGGVLLIGGTIAIIELRRK